MNEHLQRISDLIQRESSVADDKKNAILQSLAEAEQAEVQNKKIEMALELVRTRTLAMRKSSELAESAQVVFQQLANLGNVPARISIGIPDQYTGLVDFWVTDQVGNLININFKGRLDEPTTMARARDAWQSGSTSLVIELEGQELTDWIRFVRDELGILVKPEFLKDKRVHSIAFFTHGWIMLTSHEPLSINLIRLLERFGAVFNLTYTRFLDLQKAEEQAREAQIEASLERVRSSAMAMQKSDDLARAVAIVFDELDKLNLETLRCGVAILDKAKRSADLWTAAVTDEGTVAQVAGDESMDIHPLLQGAFEAWLQLKDYSYLLEGEDLNRFYTALASVNYKLPDSRFTNSPGSTLQQYLFVAHFPAGGLYAFRETPFTDEARVIVKRFADVFNLTYTRFNDLQKAEAQAREATVEAALEKVRGKAMAMRESSDLSATASMVFTELRKLGIRPIRFGVGLLKKETRVSQLYSATTSAKGDSLSLVGWVDLSGHPVLSAIYDSWLKREDYFPVLSGEDLKSYYELLLQGLSVPSVPDWQTGEKQWGHFINFSEGCLYAWSASPYTDGEIMILKRFTNIIDLTFRRYIELQQSEANAQATKKQAALDRIRAEIASMRTVSDLERITPLIWNELTIIGIPFVRCGVFIMDETEKHIHTFLSTPDGKAIGAFHLPYEATGTMTQVLVHWQRKEIYKDHWDEKAFTGFATTLVEKGALSSADQYLKSFPPGGFYLHFLPFLQGMLYVGNTTPLGDKEIASIQSVADAFSTAYARYEDFNRLEAAKQQVEKTLADLKQAQAQLVQAEKMASLGELTAGIAHEIQNPLNFVNNFSEVNTELLEELKSQHSKSKNEPVEETEDDLLNSIIENEKKINHHGKRADAIVKGMLQHSRSSSSAREFTDINALADEYLRLAYHGLRGKDKTFNVSLVTDYDGTIGKIHIMPQEIGRVLLNLYNNAFYAVNEKKEILKQKIHNSQQQPDTYEPTVTVSTRLRSSVAGHGITVVVSVKDNGIGIPEKIADKIFQPFFTTKPTGKGTGLGLSLAYDIVKAHGGELKVEASGPEGANFIVVLPV